MRTEFGFSARAYRMKLAQSGNDVVGTEKLVPAELDRSHFVLVAFEDVEFDNERSWRRSDEFDIVRPIRATFDFKINVTFITIKFAQTILVLLDLLILKIAVAGDP